MSRRSHRCLAALFAVLSAALFVGPALGAPKKGAPPKRTESPKADGKAKVSANEDRSAATKPASKQVRPAKAEPAAPARSKATPDPAQGTTKRASAGKTPEKAPASSTGKAKSAGTQAAPAKRASTGKQVLLPSSQPIGAKSLPKPDDGERAAAAERGLKPPGQSRPMVRQVTSRLITPPREVAERTLAFRYANLGDAEAIAELNRRGIAWVPATPPLPGVRTPIRLSGPLRGVTIHSTLPEPERRTTAFEILDARLALALDDFCALLARHDVVELVHYTMYRPPAELPSDWNKQIRHPAGLAIDVGAVRKADGRWLAIGPHWPSDIGAKTCGEGAREHWSRPGREIVSIACEAADLGMFHFILTPHFDAAHADHLHLEIKPDTRWFLVN